MVFGSSSFPSIYILFQTWGPKPSRRTESPKEKGHKFAPGKTLIASKFQVDHGLVNGHNGESLTNRESLVGSLSDLPSVSVTRPHPMALEANVCRVWRPLRTVPTN